MGRSFPFARLLGLGVGLLGLSPHDFWAMTPRELTAALAARRPGAPQPLNREALNALMQRFPDSS